MYDIKLFPFKKIDMCVFDTQYKCTKKNKYDCQNVPHRKENKNNVRDLWIWQDHDHPVIVAHVLFVQVWPVGHVQLVPLQLVGDGLRE